MKGQKGKLAEFVRREPAREALSLEERVRRADAAMGASVEQSSASPVSEASVGQTEVAPTNEVSETNLVSVTKITQTPVTQTPVSENIEPPSLTPVVTQTPVRKTPVQRTPVKGTGLTEIPVDGRMWLNHPAVLNWALDDFLPSFDHNAQAVLLRLLRLTLGFRRRNCLVTTATLVRKTRLSEPTVNRVVRALRDDGYLETKAVIGGKRDARGNEFILADKALPPTDVLERTPVTQTPVRGTGVTATDMKSLKSKNEREAPAAVAPAIDVRASTLQTLRAIAKSYRHSTPDVDDEDVRTRLRQWFETEGRDADEAAIDEAARGGKA